MRRSLSGAYLVLLMLLPLSTAAAGEVLVSVNLGDGAYSASGAYLKFTPPMAFDGNAKPAFTYWNSGDFPSQWVEVDLQRSYSVQRVNLIVAQRPDGETTHEVWASSQPIREDTESATRVITFDGFTKDRQWLMAWFTQPQTARYIQIRTIRSPSWVAWKEIQVVAVLPE